MADQNTDLTQALIAARDAGNGGSTNFPNGYGNSASANKDFFLQADFQLPPNVVSSIANFKSLDPQEIAQILVGKLKDGIADKVKAFLDSIKIDQDTQKSDDVHYIHSTLTNTKNPNERIFDTATANLNTADANNYKNLQITGTTTTELTQENNYQVSDIYLQGLLNSVKNITFDAADTSWLASYSVVPGTKFNSDIVTKIIDEVRGTHTISYERTPNDSYITGLGKQDKITDLYVNTSSKVEVKHLGDVGNKSSIIGNAENNVVVADFQIGYRGEDHQIHLGGGSDTLVLPNSSKFNHVGDHVISLQGEVVANTQTQTQTQTETEYLEFVPVVPIYSFYALPPESSTTTTQKTGQIVFSNPGDTLILGRSSIKSANQWNFDQGSIPQLFYTDTYKDWYGNQINKIASSLRVIDINTNADDEYSYAPVYTKAMADASPALTTISWGLISAFNHFGGKATLMKPDGNTIFDVKDYRDFNWINQMTEATKGDGINYDYAELTLNIMGNNINNKDQLNQGPIKLSNNGNFSVGSSKSATDTVNNAVREIIKLSNAETKVWIHNVGADDTIDFSALGAGLNVAQNFVIKSPTSAIKAIAARDKAIAIDMSNDTTNSTMYDMLENKAQLISIMNQYIQVGGGEKFVVAINTGIPSNKYIASDKGRTVDSSDKPDATYTYLYLVENYGHKGNAAAIDVDDSITLFGRVDNKIGSNQYSSDMLVNDTIIFG